MQETVQVQSRKPRTIHDIVIPVIHTIMEAGEEGMSDSYVQKRCKVDSHHWSRVAFVLMRAGLVQLNESNNNLVVTPEGKKFVAKCDDLENFMETAPLCHVRAFKLRKSGVGVTNSVPAVVRE